MRKFITTLAVVAVALVGAATASATVNDGGSGAGKYQKSAYCLVNAQGQETEYLTKSEADLALLGEFILKNTPYAFTITKGACVDVPAPAVTPQIDREGSCTVVGNQFENVDADQLSQGSYVATDGSTVAIVPADFVEGLGLTCDVPKGATPAGYDVADNFGGVEGVVDTAAPQFNFYPYYTQA